MANGSAVAEPVELDPATGEPEADPPKQAIGAWVMVLYDDGHLVYAGLDQWNNLMMAFDKKLVTEVTGPTGMHMAVDGARIKYLEVQNLPALQRLQDWRADPDSL